MKKSFLSILIVLALCLTLLPTAALADTSPADVAVTFPQPVPGANISQSMQAAAGNAGSGLTLYLTGPSLWQDGKISKLNENEVYAEGSVYMLQFIFYTQEPITTESGITCNGNPVTLYSDYDALTGALSAYDGAQDAYMAYVMFSEDGTGDPDMDLTDLYLLTLFAFVRVSRPLTTVEVSTAADLRTAIETGTDDIVKLTGDITISESLTVSRSVTLDLNDHVLTITGDEQFLTVSGRDTKVTLTDSAETKTERKFSINQDGAWVPDENGDKTVTGGVITGGKTGADLYGTPAVNSGVCIENHGTLTVTDGTVSAPIRNIRGTIAGSGTFNGTVINEDKLTGGIFNGPVANYMGKALSDATISGGIFYGTVANGYNYYTANGEEALDGRKGGLIAGGTFYGKVTNAFQSKISGGSFYGEVDNRDRSDFRPNYLGILAGGTFYAGHPGTVADGCCTVTYNYGNPGGTYAIQIVQEAETAIRPTDPDGKNLTFTGWYRDPDGTNPYDFTGAVTGDMTLYAGWEESVLGIIVTDENGNEVYVTNKNYADVLGDGTVSYTWGGFNSSEIPSEYWDDSRLYITDAAIEKLLAGEEIPGVELSKLTLNGAKLQKIEAFCVPGSSNMYLWYFPIELKGENRITYSGTDAALDWTENPVLLLTGGGSLTVDAPGAKTAVAFGDNGRYYQRGGNVTLTAKDYGIAESPYDFTFTDGSLTIQAGNPENSGSGALCNADSFFDHCSITENAAFLLGDSADAPVKFYPPFTRESLFDQYMNALDAETITHEPYYVSLFTSCTVTFDSNGGSAVDVQAVTYGKTAQEPAVPTRSGYTFVGWYLGETAYDFDTPVTENITLTAHWTFSEQFSLAPGGTYYFDLSGENLPGLAYNDLPDTTLHYVPFTYAGTVDAYSLESETDDDTQSYNHSLFIADYNVTHFVSWDELTEEDLIFGRPLTANGVSYTLRAPSAGNHNEGSYGDSDYHIAPTNNEWDAVLRKSDSYIGNWDRLYSAGQDTQLGAKGMATYRGYLSVGGWIFTVKGGGGSAGDCFRPVLEVPTTAGMDADALKAVTLDLNGGSLGKESSIAIIVKNGAGFTAPAAEGLTRPAGNTGSRFRWLGDDGNLYLPGETVPASVSALTAQWEYDSSDSARCRLIFETGGGSALPTVIVPFGTTVELAEYVPARTGYVFTGWYADKTLTEKITSVKMAGDRTVYAGWRTSGLPFDDVQPDDWFFGDVQYVYENDLMNGTSANRFSPLSSTTRAMVVTVLWRLENSPVVNYAMSFKDVNEGAWYGEAVRWAAASGIVTGYDAETFGPNDSVTREQLAAILYRYAEYRDIDVSVGEDTNILSYEDALTISDYAVPAMQWACGAGLIQGADGRLMPRSDASRAQIAAILHRFCENCMK